MEPLFELVPNVSEGRNRERLSELVAMVEDSGADVLDWSADPDHHRAVLTLIGDAQAAERAAVALARFALENIDLRRHTGVHPRIGALDVLPIVPLAGTDVAQACAVGVRIAERLVAEGLPVCYYGSLSTREHRTLADLRRGGYEALVKGFPAGQEPDLLPPDWPHPGAHPTAGVTCVGVRPLLLAWNVYVEGLGLAHLKEIARSIRERGGGFKGVRALAFELPSRGSRQISMNLENLDRTSPFDVFEALERSVAEAGGRVVETEVIGMIPDGLVLPAAADRLRLSDADPERLLSSRILVHLAQKRNPDR
jgi:glutamate formiminotransferase